MAQIYYEGDADLDLIVARRVAVIGYGSQGRAHALNLRDSGCDVRIGTRPRGASAERARADGFRPDPIEVAAGSADVISLLLPDHVHADVYGTSLKRELGGGKLLLVAHGFSIQYGHVRPEPDVDVALVAPVGPGDMLRSLYGQGKGIPAALAVHQNPSGTAAEVALAYAAALGSTRAGVITTSFQEETETDLFGEQAVLCGGLSSLLKAGFDTLVENGYQPEVAYFECVHQVKLVVDLIYEGGVSHMFSRISDTAEFGSYLSGPRVIDDHVRTSMQGVLDDVRDGRFASRWQAESSAGLPTLNRERKQNRDSMLEEVGGRLRKMMPWLQSPEDS